MDVLASSWLKNIRTLQDLHLIMLPVGKDQSLASQLLP